MKPLSIQSKLTAWYFAVLILTLGIFGFAALLAMEKGIQNTVDEGLRNQERGIAELMGRVLSEESEEREELEHELREHSEIRTEADFSQVFDQRGNWIYRTPLMARYGVPIFPPNDHSSIYYDLNAQGLPLRVFVSQVSFDEKKYGIQVASPMNGFYGALNRFKLLLLVLTPFLVVLASTGGYLMSRRALTPVDEIIQEAKGIDSKNLSKRLKVLRSGDELQRLSETLNGMLERPESAFNRITQFTADASHELRTPLALMRTTLEVSLRTSHSESEHREAQAQTLEELEKTSALVEKLMLLARADAGVETLHRSPLDLADTLRDVCRQGRTLAESKQINFEEKNLTTQAMVDGDRDALYRLFLILIDNAVKYTAPGGLITVSLTAGDQTAVVEVRDTGIGIATNDLPHIFDRFYRADKARSRESGGVGLGLSIARWEAEAHGGSIEVQSSVGKGSTFRVRLPAIQS
jgi:heavy metal sensor kinase